MNLITMGLKAINEKTISGIFFVVFIISTAITHTAQATPAERIAGYDGIPSVSGIIRRYSEDSPEVFNELWVSISPRGMRVTDSISKSEIVKNFEINKIWMINRKHSMLHQLDVEAFRRWFPNLVQVLVSPDTRSNILGRTPCLNWIGNLNGERVWRGNIVQDWTCVDDSGFEVSQQIFNERLGLVVRVKHPDGMVEELRDVINMDDAQDSFVPEKGYKSVGLVEFRTRRKQLEAYSE